MLRPHLLKFDDWTCRASALSKIMGSPRGTSPMKKYLTAKENYAEEEAKLSKKVEDANEKLKTLNEGTKAYTDQEDRIIKYKGEYATKTASMKLEIAELEKHKDEIILSDTCETYLLEVYEEMYSSVIKDIENRYTKKGHQAEDNSIAMLSEVHDYMYEKNKIRKHDTHFQGECDIDESIILETTIDTKSSWDRFTFRSKLFEVIAREGNHPYWWQGQGYMELFGSIRHIVAFTLVNTPKSLVQDEKTRLLYKMGSDKKETQEYESACQEIDMKHNFDNMTSREKVIEKPFEKDTKAIQEARERVELCRRWLNNFSVDEFIRVWGADKLMEMYPEVYAAKFPIMDAEYEEVEETQTEETVKTEEPIQENHVQVPEERVEEIKEQVLNAIQDGLTEAVIQSENISEEIKTETVETGARVIEVQVGFTIDLPSSYTEEEKIIIKDCIDKVEECKNSDDCIKLYQQILPHFQKYPEVKKALTDKRLGFQAPPTPKEEPPKPPAAKPPAPKPPAPAPPKQVTPVEEKPNPEPEKTETINGDDTAKINEIKDAADKCKTAEEIKNLYKANKDFVNKNPDLRDYLTKIGGERENS